MKKLLILLTLCSIYAKAQSFQGLLKKATEIASGATKTGLSSDEIANGLKEALRIGAEKGCTNLAKPDGFFKNAALKILMPPEAAKVESTLRSVGLNQLADDFILYDVHIMDEKKTSEYEEFVADDAEFAEFAKYCSIF